MNEQMEPIHPAHAALLMGKRPEPCEPFVEISSKVLARLLDVVEFGDQLERVEKDKLLSSMKELLALEQPALWATYSPGPGEIHPCISKEHAEKEVKSTIEVCEKMKADRIARGQSVEFWPKIVVDVIPSPFTPLEHFEQLAEETIEHRDNLVEYVKELEQLSSLLRQHRIAVTPEHEGQWHADLYADQAEPVVRAEGDTPEAAVAAVVAAYRTMQEQQP